MTASELPGGRRRLHPLTPVYDLITTARQFWIVLIPLLRPGANPGDFLVLAILVVLVIGRITGWFFTFYQLNDDELVFDTGVLQRRNRTIPYDRVQQVDVVQKLRHRLLGVARLEVSTAGGGAGKEVRLDVLSVDEARRLQHALRAARALRAADAGDGGEGTGEESDGVGHAEGATAEQSLPLVRLGVPELVLAGVTGARLVVVLGAALTLANALDDLPIAIWGRVDESDIPAATAVTISAAIATGAVLWFGLAALSSVVTDFNFTVRHAVARFVVTKGLLSRNEIIIPDHRVQSVAFHQSILRRLLGRTAVRVNSAGGHFAIPLVPWQRGVELLGAFVGSADLPVLHAAPPAALRRAIVRRALPATAISVPLTILGPTWAAAALLAVPVAALAGWAAWRGMAHGYDDTLLVARRGALYRTFVVVPAAKAQSTRVAASWFQRRVGLATLFVDVAGGASAQVPDILDGRARELAAALVTPTQARTADDRRSRSDARPRG